MPFSDELNNRLSVSLASTGAAQELTQAIAPLGGESLNLPGSLTTPGVITAGAVATNTVVMGGQENITPAGSRQETATPIGNAAYVTGGTLIDTGVMLPNAGIGTLVIVVNDTANQLDVYPWVFADGTPSGGEVNFHGANAPGAVASQKAALFYCYAEGPAKWVSLNGGS